MIDRANKGFQWLSDEAVSEEDISKTMVSTRADSGAMHRDWGFVTWHWSMGVFRLLAGQQFPPIASDEKRENTLLTQVVRIRWLQSVERMVTPRKTHTVPGKLLPEVQQGHQWRRVLDGCLREQWFPVVTTMKWRPKMMTVGPLWPRSHWSRCAEGRGSDTWKYSKHTIDS